MQRRRVYPHIKPLRTGRVLDSVVALELQGAPNREARGHSKKYISVLRSPLMTFRALRAPRAEHRLRHTDQSAIGTCCCGCRGSKITRFFTTIDNLFWQPSDFIRQWKSAVHLGQKLAIADSRGPAPDCTCQLMRLANVSSFPCRPVCLLRSRASWRGVLLQSPQYRENRSCAA